MKFPNHEQYAHRVTKRPKSIWIFGRSHRRVRSERDPSASAPFRLGSGEIGLRGGHPQPLSAAGIPMRPGHADKGSPLNICVSPRRVHHRRTSAPSGGIDGNVQNSYGRRVRSAQSVEIDVARRSAATAPPDARRKNLSFANPGDAGRSRALGAQVHVAPGDKACGAGSGNRWRTSPTPGASPAARPIWPPVRPRSPARCGRASSPLRNRCPSE